MYLGGNRRWVLLMHDGSALCSEKIPQNGNKGAL